VELASLYDALWDICNMEAAVGVLPSVKFERRAEKQKLPAFLQAYIKTLYDALRAVRDRLSEENVRVLRFPLMITIADNIARTGFPTYQSLSESSSGLF
jgi:midasin